MFPKGASRFPPYDGIHIDMGLRLVNINPGQTCAFRCQLDDDEADVCGDAEDRSAGSFTTTTAGSQTFNSQDDWSYTLYWHMK
jgi:hypothetical protein